LFGVSLDGPQPVIVLEYIVPDVRANIHGNSLFQPFIRNSNQLNDTISCFDASRKFGQVNVSGKRATLPEKHKIRLVRGIAAGMCCLFTKNNIVYRAIWRHATFFIDCKCWKSKISG
jgi:hypothetical protein